MMFHRRHPVTSPASIHLFFGVVALVLTSTDNVYSADVDAPLADAAESGEYSTIRQLLDNGADLNAAQVDGMTALHWATYDDDQPIIGPLPGASDVLVATGHGANGLLLGPVTGRLVADLVTGGLPPVDLSAFSPARLAG